MNAKQLKSIVAAGALILTGITAQAQSLYSNAVMSLNPVAYWPLQETTQPPRYDSETNYGWLGPIANIEYASTNAAHGLPGAITGDGDASVNFLGNANSMALVPVTDRRVSLAPGQPFTVETWVRSTGGQSYVAMIDQTGGNGHGGIYGDTNSSGWALIQNYNATWTDFNTIPGNHPPSFGFHVFNGLGDSGGAEAEVTNNSPTGEWLVNGGSGYQNSWVYLCGVFDGTNCWMYMFSTNLTAAYSGTNGMDYQVPITTGPTTGLSGGQFGAAYPNAQFSPDTWDPILFGQFRNYTGNPYHGYEDEVAIYTNALTYQQITNHYMAGTNGLGNYKATILADNPMCYWRMDAPKWTNAAATSYPSATNYGTAATTTTNNNTAVLGADCGVYQPGTVPGVAGPSYPGFGGMTNACAFNGLYGAVDVGYNTLFDPTDITNNFSLVIWFAGNPMEVGLGTRYESMASHYDKSWKAQFKGNNGTAGVGGETTYASRASTQLTIAPSVFNPNDGNWHMYVMESTYTNGIGTNQWLFLDNGLIHTTLVNTNPIPGTNGDAWIGGAPDYIEPTNDATYASGQQFFAGKIAHVAYFTNALSANQIWNLYYSGEGLPVIVTNIASAITDQNGAFTNTVLAGGLGLSYQWFANGAAIADQTNASLVINPVGPGNAATNYYVVVTNSYGSATSAVVSLQVVSNLMFAAQYPITYTNPITLFGGSIIGGTNYIGSTPMFSVSPLGALPISCQWFTNGVAVGGATGTSFTFTNCQMTSPTNFYCVATNSFGAATSTVWSASYLPADMAPYAQGVLALQPVGYWRLNEPDECACGVGNGTGPNNGLLANDYEGGNNGIYTNTILGDPGYNPNSDPSDTSARFGYVALTDDDANSIAGINFGSPGGSSQAFSVEAWVNGYSQVSDSGIVTLGWGGGGEQFDLDCGSDGAPTVHGFRFLVRDAAGIIHSVASTVMPNYGNWYHLVGVVDEISNQTVTLYINGLIVGTTPIASGSGILSSSNLMSIGSRMSGQNTSLNDQFAGNINDVAIYNYALSSNQVAQQFQVAGFPPVFLQEPVSSTNVNQNSTLKVPTLPTGSAPLAYQWYDIGSGLPVPGQTNVTLSITNIQASTNYYLQVTNSSGITNSSQVSVTVYSNVVIYSDVLTPFYAIPGGGASNSVAEYGAVPLTNQWQFSNSLTAGWVNMVNNGRVSGAQSNHLAIANAQAGDVGNYQVVVANNYGAVTSSVANLVLIGSLPVTLNISNGWTFNASTRWSSGVLSMTDPNNGGGTGSSFFQVPQYVGAFIASFTYQAQYATTDPLADGTVFCLQDDPRGVTADGPGGGALAFSGIVPSVGLELNIFPGNGVGGMGYAIGYNGGLANTTVPGSVSLTNGPVDVSIYYASGQLALTMSNEVNAATFSTNLNVGDITSTLNAQTAYVGFTASYGGDTSVQTISNFKFISLPLTAIKLTGTNAALSWSGAIIANYTVQQSTNLATTNWLSVTNLSVLTNGANQVTLPGSATNSNKFYRLILNY